ncbi:hypothetical protein SLEP1_g3955 [Rubroshorea leprosula]|uniref:DUF4220 domain-containing protein n=1 Tax=Rubroshorea leprosula TaxID=152421 RepID=A0AAV5HWJ2_9ROSI|nr:hypothetical protein SLEP1_g3955 [Rubroshorea leprosula]
MPLLIAEDVEKLWDTWNIRVLIILSLLVQSFLILSAQLRKRRGGKWFIMIPLWIAYLLADWVATFTIGLMLRAERSDIVAFWAPFLLLHLGGPDTITSFSLEDNEFWIRHLLGLILQVGSTIYVILQSLPDNKLWLPTLLVLIAGVIKYAERNRAFYLASFDHFGNNWACPSCSLYHATSPVSVWPHDALLPPIPVRLKQAHQSWFKRFLPQSELCPIVVKAASTVGTIKSLLVGPPMTTEELMSLRCFMGKRNSGERLRIIEIQLSLLYELFHTKLPVVDSKTGYICRTVNFGCILGALVSFSILLKKYYHNKLGEFDICLTYGLLIGALALDLISIWLLMSSDWIIVRQLLMPSGWIGVTEYSDKKNYDKFIDKRRWSNSVPQLNIFYCRFKNKDGDYPNKLVDFLGTRFETIRRRIQCVFLENFVEEQAWKLIFTMLREKDIGEAGKEIFGPSRILTVHITDFAWTLDRFEYMESLLIWHIATEICYRKVCPDNSSSSSTSTSNDCFDHRKICKLISDYMFYLLVMEPTMTATSPNNLKIVFEAKDGTWKWPSYWKKGSKETFIKDPLDKLLEGEVENAYINQALLKKDVDKLDYQEKPEVARFSRIAVSGFLANELLNQPGGCPWNLMSRFWVELLCYAAIHCQPIVHARQVSRGGQLLTLVWLLINYLGLTPPSMDFFGE